MPRIDRASRAIAAPPDSVWRALTDPAAVSVWLPPEGMQGRMAAADPGGDGGFEIAFRPVAADRAAPAGGGAGVRVEAAEPPGRLLWRLRLGAEEMTLDWRLAAIPGGTEVTVAARGAGTGERPARLAGWLAGLAALLELE